jgi:hypothetical protein
MLYSVGLSRPLALTFALLMLATWQGSFYSIGRHYSTDILVIEVPQFFRIRTISLPVPWLATNLTN